MHIKKFFKASLFAVIFYLFFSAPAFAFNVTFDPGDFRGHYIVGGISLTGIKTLDLAENPYNLCFGNCFNSTLFNVDSSGNVTTDSTRITVTGGNIITFTTVPVVVDPGLYKGFWLIASTGAFGGKTVHLVPEGSGSSDVGRTYQLRFHSSSNLTWIDIDASGNVITDSTRINTSGNTISFTTVPVEVDPGLYEGFWSIADWGSFGSQTHYLVPEGSGSSDVGRTYELLFHSSSNLTWIDIDASGNVITDSSKINTSANKVDFNTVPINIDPGIFTSSYTLAGKGGYVGNQVIPLVIEGTGSSDIGGRYFLSAHGLAGSTTFDIDNPCAIIPSETVVVGDEPNTATFNITCPPLIVDTDNDGIADTSDNCPNVANAGQLDRDDDGFGDACDDDIDGDGYLNEADNCPNYANADQADLDGDGAGDVCDTDPDGDSVSDEGENPDNCPLTPNTDQADSDTDGDGDVCDDDDDNDGVLDGADNCPTIANTDQADDDDDGAGNACDEDLDGDGVLNYDDLCPATPAGSSTTPEGCSGAQHIELTCDPAKYPNHGRFVSCVAHTANDLIDQGILTPKEKARFVNQAAKIK